MDQDITGKAMGGNVVRKVNSVLKVLYRKSSFLKFRNRKLLCSALYSQDSIIIQCFL